MSSTIGRITRVMPSGWTAVTATAHPDGELLSPYSADQHDCPGDHGDPSKDHAVVDRGILLPPAMFCHSHHLPSRRDTDRTSIVRTAPELEVIPAYFRQLWPETFAPQTLPASKACSRRANDSSSYRDRRTTGVRSSRTITTQHNHH